MNQLGFIADLKRSRSIIAANGLYETVAMTQFSSNTTIELIIL